jgi:hypothetical protein
MIKTLTLGIAAENELEFLGRRFFLMSCRPKIDHPSFCSIPGGGGL